MHGMQSCMTGNMQSDFSWTAWLLTAYVQLASRGVHAWKPGPMLSRYRGFAFSEARPVRVSGSQMAEANAAGVWPTMQGYVMALITPHAVPGDAVRTVYASRSHRVHTCSFWRSYRPRLPLGRSVALMGGSRWRLKHTAATSEPQGAPVIVDVSERLPAPACLFAKFGDLSCTCAARRDSSPSRPAAVRSYPGSPVAHPGTVWGPDGSASMQRSEEEAAEDERRAL